MTVFYAIAVVALLSQFARADALVSQECNHQRIERILTHACALVKSEGTKAMPKLKSEKYNGPEACGNYVFVSENKNGITRLVHHPSIPGLVGANLADVKDFRGKPIGKFFTEHASRPDQSMWIEYEWMVPKPVDLSSGGAATKCTLYKNCNGSIALGLGIHMTCSQLGLAKSEFK